MMLIAKLIGAVYGILALVNLIIATTYAVYGREALSSWAMPVYVCIIVLFTGNAMLTGMIAYGLWARKRYSRYLCIGYNTVSMVVPFYAVAAFLISDPTQLLELAGLFQLTMLFVLGSIVLLCMTPQMRHYVEGH